MLEQNSTLEPVDFDAPRVSASQFNLLFRKETERPQICPRQPALKNHTHPSHQTRFIKADARRAWRPHQSPRAATANFQNRVAQDRNAPSPDSESRNQGMGRLPAPRGSRGGVPGWPAQGSRACRCHSNLRLRPHMASPESPHLPSVCLCVLRRTLVMGFVTTLIRNGLILSP